LKRRVVVTGAGMVTPLGIGVDKCWPLLCQGQSGIGTVSRFDTADCRTRVAGEVRDFNPADFIDRKLVKRGDRFIHFALASARMAMEDAGLKIDAANRDRVGVSIGTAMGGVETLEKNHRLLLQGARGQISPFFIPGFLCNMAPGNISIEYGIRGPNLCAVAACASGTQAIGNAFRLIQHGDAAAMLAGGAEAAITPLIFAGLDVLKVMTARNDAPENASRPFDRDRDGFIISEGAGIVILEELGSALKRGAKIYGEVLGFGLNSDAYHITAPDPSGRGAAACMKLALDDAAIAPEAVDYINAHGTSTALNDLAETLAVKSVFGEYSRRLPVSSNKSMIGHLWGAAGAVEAIFSLLTIKDGIIPPTTNYENPDPQCDLDYVPNVARNAPVKVALSNSFGFGSTNATLALGGYKG
jgi:3-oxoacyl-[acyl-carrier-protein] synthase II